MFIVRTFTKLLFVALLFPCIVMAQVPISDFSADIAIPSCVPLSIPFNNTSSNATSYNWTIDNAFFSDEEHPEKIFTVQGSYLICLEAINNSGADTHCETIEVYTGPDMDFVSSTTPAGCAPLEVTFDMQSNEANITDLVWDFGDGTILTTTDFTTTHTYYTSSVYDVSLTATNHHGCETFVTHEDMVDVFSDVTPQFSATNNNSCEAPLLVDFNNTSSGNLNNVSYMWDFGDGATSDAENPSHSYTTSGNYDVSLTITNNDTGCSNTQITESFVNIGGSPMFSFSSNTNGSCNQVTTNFTNETTSDVVIYFWDFGDGNTSNLENPTHIYGADGCHFPSLTVTTTAGCVVTYQSPECIEVTGSIDLNYTTSNPTSACEAPLTVSFDTDYTGSVEWDFGGQGTSNEQNPTFTFTELGMFPVTLTAILPNGCEQTVTSTTIEIAPPSVNFEADILEGCAPLAVNFTDLTNIPETITAWEWDFGDGGTSNAQHPSHTFADAGEYNVSLTITLENGCQGTAVWTNYIQPGYVPNVNFEADPTETCIENIVGFTDLSNDENIDFWEWDFGDGSFSGEQHPLHEYNDTGWFDVKLIVGYNSCYDSLIIEDYTHLFPPKAIFYHHQDCNNTGAISFTDNSLGADTWSWGFGDGNTSNLQNPTHFYAENGVYTVTLEVYNEESGCTDDMSVGIYVQVPIAGFEVNPMEACYTGSNISLQVNNTSENAVEYDWYAQGIFVVMDGENDPNPTFRFNSPGLYTGMQLTITDAAGCQDVFIYEDTIRITEVSASFSFENIDTDCNQIFQFTDASTSSFADIATWEWDFGDGMTSNEQNPIHIYGQGGYYIPSLTVTNTAGCSKTRTYPNPLQVEVPYVSFNVDTLICKGESSFFSNASIASEFVSWSWDFGNGDTSDEWNPTYTYASGGTYLACFTATNSDGCVGSLCRNILVEEITADFTADVTSASCSPLVVQFTDLSTNITSWSWDFGDNSGASTLPNPAHTYTNSGNFDVCVTMTSASGCTETICKNNFIQIGGPTAEVNYNPSASGCLDYDMVFEVDGFGIDTYVLDFGDGTTDSGTASPNPFDISHTYTAIGEFAPVLLLENEAGCQNFVILDTIRTASLAMAANATQNNFCAGTSIDFNSEIATSGTIQNIEWLFEGASPNTSNEENPTGIAYANGGDYDVTFTVTTDHCTETIVLENYIHVLPLPNLSFTATPATHCGATTVIFQNTSGISEGNIAEWSWDFGNGMLSNLESPSTFYDSVGVYQVQLTGISNEGCMSEITQTITILEEAQAEILIEDYVLCQGQTLQLESEINGTPSWSPSTGLSCTNCPNPIANPSVTTTYYLASTNSSGCLATDSITIERLAIAAPVVTLSNDTTICGGDIIQIVAAGGTTPFDYSWDENAFGLSCYQNCSNPLVEIEETTEFTVFVSNDAGCTTSKSVEIEVIGNDLDLLGPDRIICEGGSVQLNASEGTNPTWENNTSLSCLNCDNPVATPLETTNYTISIDYQGCQLSEDILVEVLSPEAVYAGEDMTICNGQTILLNGDAPGDVSWASNAVIFDTENLDTEVSPNTTTDYVLIAENDLCILSDTVRVEVTDKLTLETADIEICEAGVVQLNASGAGITTFAWTPSENMNLPNTANPSVLVDNSTTFTVIGSNGVCEGDTATVNVNIADAPDLMLPSQQSFVPGTSITLLPNTGDDENCTYRWSPNINISCTDCENPKVTPDSMITYTLVVANQIGCTSEAKIILSPISDCLEEIIVVPTGFSPNNDGHNDIFRTMGLAEINLFRIFNRWGEMVFETTNPSEGWDGKYKGKELNTDVYIWYLEAICPLDGKMVSRKGDVTLIR